MTPTTRPALTEPATRAGEELLADLFGDDVIRAAILAIEAEAAAAAREALVEVLTDAEAWIVDASGDNGAILDRIAAVLGLESPPAVHP